MGHLQKVRMARRMLSNAERARGVSIFDGNAWTIRRDAIRARIAKRTGRYVPSMLERIKAKFA